MSILFKIIPLIFTFSSLFAEMNVWIIGDGVRINPKTNCAYESKYLNSDYKTNNWVWNAKNKTVTLKGAKNEVLAFQIIIERENNTTLKNVNCIISELLNKKKETLVAEIKLFREWYVKMKEGIFPASWFADPLIPFEEEKYGAPFDLPCQDFRSSPDNDEILIQNNQAIWVDLFILEEAKPGIYQGKITVIAKNEKPVELTLKLEVFNFTVPKKQHIFVDLMNNYGCDFIKEKGLTKVKKYYQLANEHRTTLNLLYVEPGLKGEGENLSIDWTKHGPFTTMTMEKNASKENYEEFLKYSYDTHLGPYLDGSAFTTGPCKGIPLTHMFLPFEDFSKQDLHCWPFSDKEAYTEPFEKTYKKILREYEEHFIEKGWIKTELMIWYNAFENMNEKSEFKMAKYYGQLIKDSGVKLIKHRADFANKFKICDLDLNDDGIKEGTDEIFKYLDGTVQIWNPEAFEEGVDILKMQERSIKTGEEMFFFNGHPYFCGDRGSNGEALNYRVNFWICWKYNLKGFTDWNATYIPTPVHKTDGEESVNDQANVFYDGRIDQWIDYGGGGRSMFFYPGNKIGISEPIPCIRLKMMRKGAQDYEYMWLLKEQNKEKLANQLVDKIIKKALDLAEENSDQNWVHNPAEWEKTRLKMAKNILK